MQNQSGTVRRRMLLSAASFHHMAAAMTLVTKKHYCTYTNSMKLPKDGMWINKIDNIAIQGFNKHLAYTMDSILQGLCDFLYTFIYLV